MKNKSFSVLSAVLMDVTPCSLIGRYQKRFAEAYTFLLQDRHMDRCYVRYFVVRVNKTLMSRNYSPT
jgi:hypothetical protein